MQDANRADGKDDLCGAAQLRLVIHVEVIGARISRAGHIRKSIWGSPRQVPSKQLRGGLDSRIDLSPQTQAALGGEDPSAFGVEFCHVKVRTSGDENDVWL